MTPRIGTVQKLSGHRGGHVAVAEELLDGADVGAVFQQVGG
jgi:hypothetical protein